MEESEVLQTSFHVNNRAAPFYAAIVSGQGDEDSKLVIMFDEPDYTAVFSLDTLLDDEDISHEAHNSQGDVYDDALRETLWYSQGGELE